VHLSRGAIASLCALLIPACETAKPTLRTTPVPLSTTAADGRSPDLHSGNHFAYWVWKEDDGTWHLRTTAARQGHRFQGRIHPADAGSIQALAGVGLQAPSRRRKGDQLGMVDNDVVFDFTTHENLDGLDFQLVGNPCLEFDLRIDGDSDPGKVFLGRNKARPEKAHFTLCAMENPPT